MTDFATLAIKVDATETVKAADSLDKLTASGAKAERGVNKFGLEYVKASSAAGKLRIEQLGAASAASKMASEAQKAAARATGMGNSSKLAGYQVQNLAYQVNDLIVGLASGQKPMTVFMQQGTQIGQIMMQAGIGVGGIAKQVAMMAGSFLAAHPILLTVAAAAGAISAAMALVTDEINKNSSVTVTWQDTMLGAFDVVKAALTSKVTAAFEAMGLDIGEVWNSVVKYTKTAMNLVIGATMVVPKVIAATYDKIPAAFGDAFYSAANLAIEALNTLARAAVLPLNGITKAFNDAFGTKIPAITIEGIGKIANPYAGAMGALGSAGAKAAVKAFSTDYIGEMADVLGDAARNRARLREAAEKGGKDAGGSAGKAAGKAAAETFPEELQKALDEAKFWLGNLEKDAAAWAKSLASKSSLQDIGDLFDELRKKQTGYIDALVKAADIAANRAQALMGAIGGTIGRFGSALTSADPKAALLGMGGIGTLAGLVLNPNTINDLAKNIATGVRDVFGEGTPFADTMGGLLAGAGIGGIVGGSLFGGSKGSQIGSMLGGAAGQAIGSSIAALGSFGGPIGSIVGAIAGGLLGGLLKKAKTGKATFGDDLSISTSGNSSSRMAAASGLAGNVIDSLNQIADAFGATLGTFSGTVGVRNKSLRYDPTGMGNTKTSKGAIDFGQDQEALIKAVIKDAISDGVFEGLSEGVKRILNSPGDIEKNLKSALTYQGIGDNLMAAKDPTGAAIAELDKQKKAWLDAVALAGNAAEDIAKVEELYALKRVEIAKQAFEATRPAREQEIRILELLGKDTEALAASRALELEGMDPALRTRQQYIYTLEDENAALAKATMLRDTMAALEIRLASVRGDDARVKELTRAQELASATDAVVQAKLREIYLAEDLTAQINEHNRAAQEHIDAQKRIYDERYSLETQLLQLQGNTAQLRARELAQLDPYNRAIQQQIYALQDKIVAEQAAADAQKRIIDERYGLETQLLQLQGKTSTLRERELALLDPYNRGIQEQIWALQDKIALDQAAADAAAKLADEQRQLAETAAAAAKAIADERNGLMRQLWELTGNTAALRADSLAQLDTSNRALQEYIWSLEDAKVAAEAAAQAQEQWASRVNELRSQLTEAYNRESSALQGTIDKFGAFAQSIRQFRDGLIASNNPSLGLKVAQRNFAGTSRMAGLGSEGALGAFQGDAQAYLDSARQYGTEAQYKRALSEVMRGSGGAIGAAGGMAGAAQRQLDTMVKQYEALVSINDAQISFADALKSYEQATRAELIPAVTETISTGLQTLNDTVAKGNTNQQAKAADDKAAQIAMEARLSNMERMMRMSFAGDYFRVGNDSDTALTVTVDNTSANPVPVDTTP